MARRLGGGGARQVFAYAGRRLVVRVSSRPNRKLSGGSLSSDSVSLNGKGICQSERLVAG